MGNFQPFLDKIEELDKRERMKRILDHITERFPQLKQEIKWSQPMFSDHGTFIIGFSIAKHHIAVGPEAVALDYFNEDIKKAGYERTRQLFRIKWTDDIDFSLLERIVSFNIEDKKDVTTYWR